MVVSLKPEKALMKLYEYVLLWGAQFYAFFIWLKQNNENVWFIMTLISFPDVSVIVSEVTTFPWAGWMYLKVFFLYGKSDKAYISIHELISFKNHLVVQKIKQPFFYIDQTVSEIKPAPKWSVMVAMVSASISEEEINLGS